MTRVKFDLSLVPSCPDLQFETELWHSGIERVAGIDEAGRGALAGPVAVGAVVLPHDCADLADRLRGVRDSKQMSPAQRQCWAEFIKNNAVSWSVGFSQAEEIDTLGIAGATCMAAVRAIDGLSVSPQHLLVDYLSFKQFKIPQTSLVKGDARVLSIACASIMAKTARDALMQAYAAHFPEYGFAQHKGYGTRMHLNAIAANSACSLHRKSFKPIKNF